MSDPRIVARATDPDADLIALAHELQADEGLTHTEALIAASEVRTSLLAYATVWDVDSAIPHVAVQRDALEQHA